MLFWMSRRASANGGRPATAFRRPASKKRTGIDAAKTEAVRYRVFSVQVARFICDEIDSSRFRIRCIQVQGRWCDLVLECQNREDGLQTSGRAEQMSGC